MVSHDNHEKLARNDKYFTKVDVLSGYLAGGAVILPIGRERNIQRYEDES
jgi:hypothetical protein